MQGRPLSRPGYYNCRSDLRPVEFADETELVPPRLIESRAGRIKMYGLQSASDGDPYNRFRAAAVDERGGRERHSAIRCGGGRSVRATGIGLRGQGISEQDQSRVE